MVKELQSLSLDVHILSEENEEMDIPDSGDVEDEETVTDRTLLNLLGEEAALDADEEAFGEEGFTDGVLDSEGAVVSDQAPDEEAEAEYEQVEVEA